MKQRVIALLLALALLAAGVWLLWRTRYNVTLLGVALWSLLFLKEKKQKNFKRRF